MAYVTAANLTKESILKYKDIFLEYDADQRGAMFVSELAASMRKAGFHPPFEELDAIIREVDEDLSHTIDFSEFLTLMARQEYADDPEAEVQAAFNIFDINGDGKISHQELKMVLDQIDTKLSHEELMKMVRELDTDHSGNIDYNEFKIMMNH
jgi:Ca2+-binding EF-hand superfamily protein|uniref:EF-hand domain-containing protein n=1 Tax=Eutreptiella gymnastica TaxID=73025 RepID=A0A7S4GHN0_9EUGL|mmetsp:Transcript_74497/g.125544  ORF Transcript_74497/g.125544 Transcript_74497/m.125544 type:complete len:153 (+) Transcript_74497:133-591(+)|eukprot:CAMPEP_0174296990 /NCGR_PEP_ID=MMETSP0809-20121228/49662_1 /TAXON_ID=73025 ORGANISM="Eutreptiella gymnastica-like, Strain CCMP1594" /NCGR_SAMPLE_ID=MMETSP0809 /ASSEMBLY_ACC=CAM_ASM_000658 /LENGTH=152 /DNA_ID=CAMNT_0015400423 /DNA_START=133 /DNA_END=591 /DNA_ORIENTATION=-